ncbi:MAG: hemerythrin domain-containing protein [Bacteroidetes bacterium]|nr:hemerythrin domain-containing protein [Bacteroidota bacterium]MBV6461132.1 hypothetical protein [Flavobacteriales bacterium]WKZ75469.1 MAG: hemerythrin domain-containing protein [Vicingaceae bacterium]MCL4815037.1 hemerythrin domain-containing protein [Flavobacteriales bacterium]NOG94856.1 hemerythrin domain-containing protein [Bacteroidota bacterium]
MKIIDRETGKRLDKDLKQNDPLIRNVEKDVTPDEENSPMDPPGAYEGTPVLDVDASKMHSLLQRFVNEHIVASEKIKMFENALVELKNNGYHFTDDINSTFTEFFKFFDTNILEHNRNEEKALFPLLHQKLIESGEHGKGDTPQTAVDIMEDDHVKFIQLGALTFNFFGLAARLTDERSKFFVFDVAYQNARELTEMLRLHIYREDNTLFPLAQKLINTTEMNALEKTIEKKVVSGQHHAH